MTSHGNAGSAAPAPASVPKTPHQLRQGTEIDNLICSLESKWKIGLKVRGKDWSPRRLDTNDQADRICGLVKRLFYSARSALDQAVASFEELAPQFKHEDRLDLLHKTLSSKLKANDTRARTGTSKNPPSTSLKSSLLAASRISTPPSVAHSSRNDDTDSWATAVEPGSPTDVDTEEEFETPPSPSPSSRSTQRRLDSSPFVLSRSNARKRPSESSNDSGKSPKSMKTLKGKQPVQTLTPAPIPPPTLFKKPSIGMLRSFQTVASNISSTNTSFNNASASSQETPINTANTSFNSYYGLPEPHPQPKMTRTSSTTIGSLSDHEFLAIGRKIEREAFEVAKMRESRQILSQGLDRESNTTFGSTDEDALRDVCSTVEAKTEVQPQRKSRQIEKSSDTPLDGVDSVTHSVPARKPVKARSSPKTAIVQPRSVSVDTSSGHAPTLIPRTKTPAGDSPSKRAYYIVQLPTQNLFVDTLPEELCVYPYFVLFICCRLAILNRTKMTTVMRHMSPRRVRSDSEAFWQAVSTTTRDKPHETRAVWTAAKKSFEGYTFKGNVSFNGRHGSSNGVFKLDLLPIEQERSCLLQRLFGSDRFLYLTFPSFTSDQPERFRGDQMQQIADQWKLWIMMPHSFLGRTWRVFFVDPISKKNKKKKPGVDNPASKIVILFATDGIGINTPLSVGKMLNHFIDLRKNQQQSFCKIFARLELGLSRTIPTLTFKPSQIRRLEDKKATEMPETIEFDDGSLDWSERCKDQPVMNDGCARISAEAAKEIWRLYQSATGSDEPLPSAFQGRIGGAKGMWMISSAPQSREREDRDIWIEITDSQLKFDPTDDDMDDGLFNTHRCTFNYVSHSFVNGSSGLHISFIPILVDRGVKRDVIAEFINSELDKERKQLLEMVKNPVALHNWVTKKSPSIPASGVLPWQAGLPQNLPEKIKLFLRSGFLPDEAPYLAMLFKKFIKQRQALMEQKLQAPLGKSTYLFALADPEGCLKPGEVHVQFSSPFVDGSSGSTYRNLDGLEIVIARQPACRDSDIQKVRAISHPRLAHLVDVIVCPVVGQYPLAGKLQGGDYDGDKFWACWEPALVEPFHNAPAPLNPPDPAKYGISKDVRRLDQIMDPEDLNTIDEFLRESFEFRIQDSLLGTATIFLEKLQYRENTLRSERIDALCNVHDLLVDALKQGYRFTSHDFNSLVRYKLKCGNPANPAYKGAMKESAKAKDMVEGEADPVKKIKYKTENILDYLYFEVVRKHNAKTRKLLKEAVPKEVDNDPDLTIVFLQMRSNQNAKFQKELQCMLEGFDKIVKDWNRNLGNKNDISREAYNKLVEKCYASFRALVPSIENAIDAEIAPLVHPYYGPDRPTTWDYLRASAFYTTYPKKPALVWNMGGKELAQLKANSNSNTYHIVPGIFADLKAKPTKAPRDEDEDDSDDDEDESVMG
ncbi:hypothetical protein ACN47E_004011 [Coniothyrium glycines]